MKTKKIIACLLCILAISSLSGCTTTFSGHLGESAQFGSIR